MCLDAEIEILTVSQLRKILNPRFENYFKISHYCIVRYNRKIAWLNPAAETEPETRIEIVEYIFLKIFKLNFNSIVNSLTEFHKQWSRSQPMPVFALTGTDLELLCYLAIDRIEYKPPQKCCKCDLQAKYMDRFCTLHWQEYFEEQGQRRRSLH